MSPEQLSLQLTEAIEAFILITGNSPQDNIILICETFTPLILQTG